MRSNIDSQEITDFVQSVLEGIEKGIGEDYRLKGYIDFELAVVNVEKGEAGIKVLVLGASSSASKENVSKIKFQVRKKPKVGPTIL